MAYITSNNSNSIDRNANSANRQRRNWQRARQGALTNTIRTAAPLTSSSTIGLSFFTSTGLGLVSNSLALLFADASITGSASGIKVAEQASGGLSTGVGGIAVDNTVVRTTRLISTTTPLAGGGDLSADRTLSMPQATSTANGWLSSTNWTTFNNKQAAGAYLTSVVAGDTSITITGVSTIAAGLASNGGLIVSSGLAVDGFQFQSADPVAPTLGQSWFNSTSGVNKTNLASVGGNTLPGQIPGLIWQAASGAAVNNTTTKTNLAPGLLVPAGFFNVANRTLRILMVLGGNLISGNFTLTLNWGTAVMWTQTFTVNPASMWVEMIVQTTATGASGFQQTLGRVSSFNTALNFNTGGTTQNLTVATTLQWAVQFSIANVSNTLNIAYLTGELII